jgi:hypothetical protein
MAIVNRRNAVVGWVTLKTGKVVARRQAKRVGRTLKPSRAAAVVAGTATAVTLGLVVYKILRSGD